MNTCEEIGIASNLLVDSMLEEMSQDRDVVVIGTSSFGDIDQVLELAHDDFVVIAILVKVGPSGTAIALVLIMAVRDAYK